MGWLLFFLAVGAGLAMSHLAQSNRFVQESLGLFVVLMSVMLPVLAGIVYGFWSSGSFIGASLGLFAAYFGVLEMALVIAVVGLCWNGYITQVLSHGLAVNLPRWLMSDKRLTMPVTFDRGDAAMKKGDFHGALAFFKDELARHPDSPDLFLRMAEVHKALGDVHQVLVCMREAARCTADPHRKGPILIQLSERCQRTAEWAEASAVLKGMLADPALAEYHAAARARLAALERGHGNP